MMGATANTRKENADMARDAQFWITLQNTFNPAEKLEGPRGNAFYCEREYSPFRRMCTHLDPGIRRIRPMFFAGHRGSGKSSLLLRLLDYFRDDYFTIYLVIENHLDNAKANQIDILSLLGAMVHAKAKDKGLEPDPEPVEALIKSVYTITYTEHSKKDKNLDAGELTKNLVSAGAHMIGGEPAAKVVDSMSKSIFKLSSGLTEDVARTRETAPEMDDVILYVNTIIADVQGRAEKPVLIVVDGLDKLQRTTQAQLIFQESRALLAPACRIIYTVPMLIFADPAFTQSEEDCRSYMLPNIRLYLRTDDTIRYEQGYIKLHEVVEKRLDVLQLTVNEVFDPDVLDLLILKSGGILRHLIARIEDACGEALMSKSEKIDLTIAQAVIDIEAKKLGGLRLETEKVKELRTVRQDRRLSGSELCRQLLHQLYIVSYEDPGLWFDAHPLIWDELNER
jgi:hypothetical protein